MSRGLPKMVKSCLAKALDSALLAIETYNKPAIKFRSGGYIVLMNIAWTSLFHAIFIRRGIKPYYKEKDERHYKKVDGDYQFWELKTCVKHYFSNDANSPIRKNLEFFIPLRNKLEHKFMPSLDPTIFAECQSLLMSFDKIIEKEFGESYCIRESLSFALQLYPSNRTIATAVSDNPGAKKIYEWIEKYRSSISTDILKSGEYSFKAFLIQVANHDSQDAMPIQFIAYDKLTDEQKHNVERVTTLIKTKTEIHNVTNLNLMKPGEVIAKVQKRLEKGKVAKGSKLVDYFNQDTHTRCWKKYGIRPANNSEHPEATNQKYCIYDSMNKNYGYTQAWVDFLVLKMQNEEEYKSLYDRI